MNPSHWPLRRGFSLVELMTTIGILSMLVSLLLPAIQSAREAARKMQCSNNLRQLGCATHAFEAAQGHLPPPKLGTQFENRGSTLVILLPYLEESAAYEHYDLQAAVDAPANLEITSQTIPIYLCPSMNIPRPVPLNLCAEQLAPGSYVISSRTAYAKFRRLDGAFATPSDAHDYRLGFQQIRDGASKTLLFGEIDYGHGDYRWSDCSEMDGHTRWGDTTWANGYWFLAWGHMASEFPQLYNNNDQYLSPFSPRVFRSDHPGGVQFVRVDSSVILLSDDTDAKIRDALVTRAGREQHQPGSY
jgi:prepilin-type N-terminal cleavage/methylation domain-containing protein